MENNTELKSEDRLMGLFSHLSLFIGGIWLPIIFWAVNKDKSQFVKFHSLQCIFFHIAYIVIIIGFVFALVFGLLGGTLLFGVTKSGHDSAMPVFMIILIVLFYALLFIFIFGAIGYSIYMGVKTYQGELKKYPIIGNIVYKKVYGLS